METDFNKTTLLKELKEKRGYHINYVTFWLWEKKGYIQPSSHIHQGKRLVPIYYRSDFDNIVATIERLNRERKIRLNIVT